MSTSSSIEVLDTESFGDVDAQHRILRLHAPRADVHYVSAGDDTSEQAGNIRAPKATPTQTNPCLRGERSIETFRDSQTPRAQHLFRRAILNVTAHRRGGA